MDSKTEDLINSYKEVLKHRINEHKNERSQLRLNQKREIEYLNRRISELEAES